VAEQTKISEIDKAPPPNASRVPRQLPVGVLTRQRILISLKDFFKNLTPISTVPADFGGGGSMFVVGKLKTSTT